MRIPRASIRGLMLAVLALALSLAVLRAASGFWSSVLFTGAIAAVVAATIAAATLSGARRGTWAGFAIACGTYLALAFGPLATAGGLVAPPLITSALIEWSKPSLPDGKEWSTGEIDLKKEEIFNASWFHRNYRDPPPGYIDPESGLPVQPLASWVVSQYYLRVGHILCALYAGWAGAMLGRALSGRRAGVGELEMTAPTSRVSLATPPDAVEVNVP